MERFGARWQTGCWRNSKKHLGDAPVNATEVIQVIYQGLADYHRSHIIGDGALVSTIHAAKGLEFDHVLVLGGLRSSPKDPQPNNRHRLSEEERRLYYVAMTRARQTLTLIDSQQEPNPYFAEIRTSTLFRKVAVAKSKSDRFTGLGYRVLGMKDLYIDFAGGKRANHSIHRSLARLQAGDLVKLQNGDHGQVRVLDEREEQVARLSRATARRWSQSRIAKVDEVRVLGMVHRTQDDSGDPKYRDRLQVESWEVPILEVRERQ